MTFTGDEDRDRPLSPVSPVSPIASGAPAAPQTNHVRKTSNLNKPLPDLKEVGSQRPPYSQNHFASVPKRKPVPISKSSEDATKTPPKGHTFALPQWLNWRLFSRRKRLVVIGVVVAILLIALIIGLAVGLTVGKRYVRLCPVSSPDCLPACLAYSRS